MKTNNDIKSGLYVVATPIGNLGDMTFRAVEVLKAADVVAAEDTRTSSKLFSHFGIKRPMISFHEHSPASALEKIEGMIREGKIVALITDAGTPLISDPGFELVRNLREKELPVFPIPGASSAVAALSVSGLPSDRFMFIGFSPPKSGKRQEFFKGLKSQQATLIFFESPARVVESLQDMLAVFGNRKAFIGRELTKLHEEGIYGNLDEVAGKLAARESIKGEFVVALEGAKEEESSSGDVESLLRQKMENTSVRDATKEVAEMTGMAKNEVYKIALRIQNETR